MTESLPDGGRVSHVLYCFAPDRLDEAIDFWQGSAWCSTRSTCRVWPCGFSTRANRVIELLAPDR